MFKPMRHFIMTALSLDVFRFMLAMGYSDVMPLSMLQHVQMNLDEYRGNGKKSKKALGDDFEEKPNTGVCRYNTRACNKKKLGAKQWMMLVLQVTKKARSGRKSDNGKRTWTYTTSRARPLKCLLKTSGDMVFALFVVDDGIHNNASCYNAS
jgi:hypothetical protein